MTYLPGSLELLAYLVLARLIVWRMSGLYRQIAFALLNLVAVFWLVIYEVGNHRPKFDLGRFAFYLGLVGGQYLFLRLWVHAKGWRPWLAFSAPLAVLVFIRYFILLPQGVLAQHFPFTVLNQSHFLAFVGISYMAFRCSRLALEIRNAQLPVPTVWEYLSFAFFLPTLSVGPINTYVSFRQAFGNESYKVPAGRAFMRIGVGMVKYLFLGGFFSHLGFSGLLLDDHYHHWIDMPIAMVFYYLYLYCNFSGFCDMAVGASAFIGIPVAENFDNPFAARNIKDFWNRWHITLSVWMRDIVFAPLSKFMVGTFGPVRANHAIALTITVVFLLVGIWHGVGWNYAIYGAIHALGVVANHYYTIGLKKWLGREGFKAYNENRWIRAAAVVMTFMYCAASLLFFANTLPQIREIFSILR